MAKKVKPENTFEWRISQIPQILEWVEKQDVERLTQFLVQSPNTPLYCFSSGGASSSLHYCALLYETNRGMAKALTPLMMSSLSDETLKSAKILLFSKSGQGKDEEQIVNRAVKVNPQGVCAISRDNDEKNHLINTVINKTGTNNWFQFKWPEYEDAFISSTSPFAVMGLFYKAFTKDSDIVSKLNIDLTPSNCYSYKTKGGEIIKESKGNIKTFIALYSGWSEPTAIDFESKMVEGGIASVQLCDYRNFCHGRFIYLSNHLEDSAFVLFVTPREKEFVRRFFYEAMGDMGRRELFPSATKIITIETEMDSPLATIDLMIKTSVCFSDIAKDNGQEPLNPSNPFKIDKRWPRSFPYTGLAKTPLMGNVIQGIDGTLKGVNRKKVIKYDPTLSIQELAALNNVKEPTIQKYIKEHNIDRQRDAKMILYNRVWEEYIKNSGRSRASIARTLDISENTLKLYLDMKTPPFETAEGKVGRVAESDVLSKLRNKLKGKVWDINLRFKYGAVVKDGQETAIPEPTELQGQNAKETPTRKKKASQGVRKSSDSLEGIEKELRKKLKRAKIKTLEELYERRNAILKKEKERVAQYREVYANAKPLTWDDFSFRKTHTYDTSKVDCWSFNSFTDVRSGISLNVGNMSGEYGVSILGIDFKNSEVPYQLAIFKNDEASIAVQKEVANPLNPLFSNGYRMKNVYIKKGDYAPYRRDTQFENGKEMWCYEWMKWVVWEKVKQNKGFRDILLAIPKNAVIIEQAQRRKQLMWGCWNEELKKERDLLRLAYTVENGISYKSPKAKNAEYQVNCASKWVGENAMGQILTMAKLALNEGVQMPIDAKMLNDAKICWFGDVLVFTEQNDGSVTVEAKPSETQDKLQEAIQKPLMPKLARAKVTVTKEIKPSQEVKESSDGRVHGIIGAVIGEVIGSRFEFSSPPKRKVDRFTTASTFTDDTVLTVAVADALLHGRDYGEAIFDWARRYPNAGFGRRFLKLMKGKEGISTDSFGNGGGMRVSPIGFHAKTLEEALEQARLSAIPSHNSVEGIKGAQSIAAATFLAKQQKPKEEIKAYIEKEFGYNLDRTDEEIAEFVSKLRHGDSKKGIPSEREFAENTCPLAIIAFLVTDDYESSIWKSISYGCDTDTVACMCGGIAAAYYGVPQDIINEVTDYLPHEILNIINEFDHTNLQNTRTTPHSSEYKRWGATLVYGSGIDEIVNEKGKIVDEGGYDARQDFGAKSKVREGICERSYAIPTMGKSLEEIKEGVDRFIEYAETHQEETFLVIEIGCIKAGYAPMQIAPMFERAKSMSNVYLPKVFTEVPEVWEKKTRKKKEKEDER